MTKIDGICKEVLEKTEWIAIATAGPEGPHVVGTWGDYVCAFGIHDDTLLVPVGGMHRTEANLKTDKRVELLSGTRAVRGTHGPGKGCAITGTAEFQTAGPHFDTVKARFPWARAAMVMRVEEVMPQL